MNASFVVEAGRQMEVASIGPWLRSSLGTESVMDPAVMTAEDIASCPWVGYGIGKGLTSVERNMSLFGIPSKNGSGWHGELIRGLPGTDPSPLCYKANDPQFKFGFADFVRWVYFAGDDESRDVFGLDYGLGLKPEEGVANSVVRVYQTAIAAISHGIPDNIELVLLNYRMTEEPAISQFRRMLGLHTVGDWARKGPDLFAASGNRCRTCGLDTRKSAFRYCYRCTADFLTN